MALRAQSPLQGPRSASQAYLVDALRLFLNMQRLALQNGAGLGEVRFAIEPARLPGVVEPENTLGFQLGWRHGASSVQAILSPDLQMSWKIGRWDRPLRAGPAHLQASIEEIKAYRCRVKKEGTSAAKGRRCQTSSGMGEQRAGPVGKSLTSTCPAWLTQGPIPPVGRETGARTAAGRGRAGPARWGTRTQTPDTPGGGWFRLSVGGVLEWYRTYLREI